jgi:hypothetical protein
MRPNNRRGLCEPAGDGRRRAGQFLPVLLDGAIREQRGWNAAGADHGRGGGCIWGIGSTLPNTINNFGGNSTAEFGALHASTYYAFGGGGKTQTLYDNFQQVLPNNPC